VSRPTIAAQAGSALLECPEQGVVTHEDAARFVRNRIASLEQDCPVAAVAVAQIDTQLVRNDVEPAGRLLAIAQVQGFDRQAWNGFAPDQAQSIAFILAGIWDARCGNMPGCREWLRRADDGIALGNGLVDALVALVGPLAPEQDGGAVREAEAIGAARNIPAAGAL